MKAIIIEDEKLSAEHLQTLLLRIDKSIQIISVYDSVKSVLAKIEKIKEADLLFVDIHLADGLSFEIFAREKIETPIIFTTAYNEYAIKAFKVNSIDYLLKPIGIEDLKTAVEKFNKLNTTQKQMPDIAQFFKSMSKSYKNRFMVKMGENIVTIKTEEINHFIAEDGIVLLSTKGDRRYAVDYTIDELVELLDPKLFFRINRKVIINVNSIQKISTYFNSRLKIVTSNLKDDDCIVSRERVNDFKQWLDDEGFEPR